MNVWHLTADAPRSPRRVPPGQQVALDVGTWPVEAGQSVAVRYRVVRRDGLIEEKTAEARWVVNSGVNSYWRAEVGPFFRDDSVTYEISGRDPTGNSTTTTYAFRVGPTVYLALLWHHHQPLYKDTLHPTARGSYHQPWVRLHALRDYYSMASLVTERPRVHMTINLTAVLLWQIEDYVARGATDTALELTVRLAEDLGEEAREELLSTFFDADLHGQIFCHPRYQELFSKRVTGERFAVHDLRDLQMWFNLAWFGKEFREGDVTLVTGEVVSVRRFIEKQRDFSVEDVQAIVAEQFKILRAVVPVHRKLQVSGQIEVATTPFYHPILPLIVDTDKATVDRPGDALPRRFARFEDAEAQVRNASACYRHSFGQAPRGMWPAEGAVSQSVVPLFAAASLGWIATDAGVLARSGQWGYAVDDPDVLCRPYLAREGSSQVSVFFRDTTLSDAIGFRYSTWGDSAAAARDFIDQIKARFATRFQCDDDRVLTIALDGENPWGSYSDDGRPFLDALYDLFNTDPEIEMVCFSEYITGNLSRGIASHGVDSQPLVHDLFTGSWIDQYGSAPGVDLGTWIGHEEKNRAWEALGDARAFLDGKNAEKASIRAAREACYAAEGSDWFWWFGDDHTSGHDNFFDDLFRTHLSNVYLALGVEPPSTLRWPIKPRAVEWSFYRQAAAVPRGGHIVVQVNCPGRLHWRVDEGPSVVAEMTRVGGVMAGVGRHQVSLGPFDSGAHSLRFRFECTHSGCQCENACCSASEHRVRIEDVTDVRG